MSLNTNALTTVERVADYMGMSVPSNGSTKYKRIERAINAVSQQIENYVGQNIKQTSYTEVKDANPGQDSMILDHTPVISVSSFQYRNSIENVDEWETFEAKDYRLDTETGIIYLMGRSITRGVGTYRASYSAGYVFDNSTTFLSDAGAADLEDIVWQLASLKFERVIGAIKSERIGDYSVSYQDSIFDNEDVRLVLDKYTANAGNHSYSTPPFYI